MPFARNTIFAFAAGGLFLGACSANSHSGMDMGGGTGTTMNHSSMAGSTLSVDAKAAFNATDIAFAQGMIVHHAQAIEMADQALRISKNPKITTLATQIKAAQGPEIATMSDWLKSWGRSVPDTKPGATHDMSSDGRMMMSGMMSAADMGRLENATDTEFDRIFLELMIQHHQGAIEMANLQVKDGKYQPVKDLAKRVVTAQTKEIADMKALLAEVGQ